MKIENPRDMAERLWPGGASHNRTDAEEAIREDRRHIAAPRRCLVSAATMREAAAALCDRRARDRPESIGVIDVAAAIRALPLPEAPAGVLGVEELRSIARRAKTLDVTYGQINIGSEHYASACREHERAASASAADVAPLLASHEALVAALAERTRERDEWGKRHWSKHNEAVDLHRELRVVRGQVGEARGHLEAGRNGIAMLSVIDAALAALSREAPSPEPTPEENDEGLDAIGRTPREAAEERARRGSR